MHEHYENGDRNTVLGHDTTRGATATATATTGGKDNNETLKPTDHNGGRTITKLK
jgi:hypothetical protein